ncbi:MAG TPA: DUF2780 domain-containing protein [Rhodocyclaceae bacterium]|nr:DUF2780 domain-containing protein [Rhodocyclaceae bacterium]
MDLIQQLMTQMKVNERQAKGGIGALLYIVKDQVSPDTFDAVRKLLPEADAWMKISPEGSEGIITLLDGVFGRVAGSKLDTFARLGGHFQSLGVAPSMVKPFSQTVLTYLRDNLQHGARNQIANLLAEFMK